MLTVEFTSACRLEDGEKMPYKSGVWGPDEKQRSKHRQEYFRAYQQQKQSQCTKCGAVGKVAPSGLCKKCIAELFPFLEVKI